MYISSKIIINKFYLYTHDEHRTHIIVLPSITHKKWMRNDKMTFLHTLHRLNNNPYTHHNNKKKNIFIGPNVSPRWEGCNF